MPIGPMIRTIFPLRDDQSAELPPGPGCPRIAQLSPPLSVRKSEPWASSAYPRAAVGNATSVMFRVVGTPTIDQVWPPSVDLATFPLSPEAWTTAADVARGRP